MKRLLPLFFLIVFIPVHHAHAAIAFGATTTSSSAGAVASLSWTGPAVSGSNTVGVVNVYCAVSSDNVTSVTWGGVSMTQEVKRAPLASDVYSYIYYILNPASSATVTINASPNCGLAGTAHYYTGVKQTTTVDCTNTAQQSGTSASFTVSGTTIADNAWIFSMAQDSSAGSCSSVTTGTQRNRLAGFYCTADNGPKTPAGSISTVYAMVSAANKDGVLICMAPALNTLQFIPEV